MNVLECEQMRRLATLIEEAARSTKEGIRFFVEPADGVLRRAVSRRHHVVFGRRGSGKSSLLTKAKADLSVDRRPVAWVDLEPFKGHSYPDLLISVLISTLKAFREWIATFATAPSNKSSLWQRLFGRKPTRQPFDQKRVQKLIDDLDRHLASLEAELHSTDEAEIETNRAHEAKAASTAAVKSGIEAGPATLSGEYSSTREAATELRAAEKFKRSKVEFLKRHVIDYQRLFDEMAAISNGDSFVLLDDLYHIRKSDQPSVVDYLHSIGKGHSLWVKIGTIRHRTRWYLHGNPPIGVKLGDDADEINLDLTLEKYATTKKFLSAVIEQLSASCELSVDDYLTEGAIDRLVLASGGVARDFLGILRRAIDVAREREDLDRRPKLTAEDVNVAAGEYDTTKQDEFRKDTYTEEERSLNRVFQRLRNFCLDDANSNCFLIEQDYRGPMMDAINELVDLKLLHRIRSRVTVNTRTQRGKLFQAYMLDLSQYAGARKRRGLDIIEFWKPGTDNLLRRAKLIFHPEDDSDKEGV